MSVVGTSVHDEEQEDRRRWLWLLAAVAVSVVLHVVLYGSFVPSRSEGWAEEQAAQTLFVDTPPATVGPGADSRRTEPEGEGAETTATDLPRQGSARALRPTPNTVSPNTVSPNTVSAEDPDSPLIPVQTEETESGDPDGEAESNEAFLAALAARSQVARGPGSAGGCGDPLLGTWRARRYDTDHERHVTFTLRIEERRPAGGHDALTGTITLRAWNGGRDQRSPPRCRPGVSDHTVRQPATGQIAGDQVRFEGRSHVRTINCIDAGQWVYNLDRFTGTLEGNTLSVVNNDGGNERNAPYRFRRTACN